MITALEMTYADIRAVNPDLPPVLIITGRGFERKKQHLGHYAHGAWSASDAGRVSEIFIAGETLHRGAKPTFTTLLHEAVHALAAARKVKDTSRGNRYHNRRFVELAAELGLQFTGEPDKVLGYSNVTVAPATWETYADTVADLGRALAAVRPPVSERERAKKKSTNNLKAMCPCGRVIRASKKVLAGADISCAECGHPFRADDDENSEGDE